jgi:putative sterol carrier protein
LAILDRVKKAWNAFRSSEETWSQTNLDLGPSSYGSRPNGYRARYSAEKSIVSSVYTKVGIDVAGADLRHIQVDSIGRYVKDVESKLNECLCLEPNIDQAPRAFRQDIATTLFNCGVAAIVPVDTSVDPANSELYDIYTLRVGEIISWYPQHVRVSLYNEAKGIREEITLEKKFVAIVENPLYQVMNEPNSTLQRLMRKLSLLDNVDEMSVGRLDLIIQLPYVIKSDARKQQAEERRKEIEFQLKSSQFGIAYADGTEKIVQLNRPVDNQLLKQVEYLTDLFYSQLGITNAVMQGTADEAAMLNYYNRTVEPIVEAIKEAMQRSFLGTVKVHRGERIEYFKDPFKLVPITQVAEIADKFSRNEILTANEIRGFMGIAPSPDPKADLLLNSNMPPPKELLPGSPESEASLSQSLIPILERNGQNGSRF